MKISLALGQRRPLDRTTAWGCLTANLAVPGCGSLVAGRVAGYFQLLLAVAGLALTMFFGIKFVIWYIANGPQAQSSPDDIGADFQEMWSRLRWALLGMLVFLAGLLWAVASSIGILLESKPVQPASPPVLGGEKR
jgi:hypothetical protein